MYSGIFRHATNPLALYRMLTKHQLHLCPHPTHHSHDYHTRTPTVTNRPPSTRSSSASEDHPQAPVVAQQQQQQPANMNSAGTLHG